MTIRDEEGFTWGVSVGIEDESRYPRYYIRGMSAFVADKELQPGDEMHFLFFQNQGVFKLSNVVKGNGN